MSPVRVSAVVPVWNPGPSFTRCVGSLLAQDLPPEEYEIVLVDDGSTDGTAELLDELAERHGALVRVIHTPNSGWPGRPRNVGIDAARGEFVHLVDNDDSVPPYALRTLCEAAERHHADVAFGTPASDFRGLNHTLYRDAQWAGTLAQRPELSYTLTPHKMFRRSLLVRHGIRFPEGPVPLEDQFFVMAAYIRARSIVVLADRCYYRYLRRLGSGRNAGDRPMDPSLQCDAVGKLAALVSEVVDDGPVLDRLLRRFLTVNLLPRVAERAFTDADDTVRHELVEQVAALVERGFPPPVRDGCGAAHRVQVQTLLGRDLDALDALSRAYQTVGVRVGVTGTRWVGGRWVLDLSGGLYLGEDPVRCDAVAGGWALPADRFPSADEDHRRLDPARDEADVELALVSRNFAESYGTTAGVRLSVADDGRVVIAGRVEIDPERAAAGHPLEDGMWDLLVRVRWAGWNRAGLVTLAPDVAVPPPMVADDGRVLIATTTGAGRALLLDVAEWRHSFAARIADEVQLATGGRRREVALSFPLASAAAALPRLELSLAADDGAAGLQDVSAAVTVRDGVAVARFALPRVLPDATWNPWLTVFGSAAPPVRLPWLITTAGAEVRVAAAAAEVSG